MLIAFCKLRWNHEFLLSSDKQRLKSFAIHHCFWCFLASVWEVDKQWTDAASVSTSSEGKLYMLKSQSLLSKKKTAQLQVSTQPKQKTNKQTKNPIYTHLQEGHNLLLTPEWEYKKREILVTLGIIYDIIFQSQSSILHHFCQRLSLSHHQVRASGNALR